MQQIQTGSLAMPQFEAASDVGCVHPGRLVVTAIQLPAPTKLARRPQCPSGRHGDLDLSTRQEADLPETIRKLALGDVGKVEVLYAERDGEQKLNAEAPALRQSVLRLPPCPANRNAEDEYVLIPDTVDTGAECSRIGPVNEAGSVVWCFLGSRRPRHREKDEEYGARPGGKWGERDARACSQFSGVNRYLWPPIVAWYIKPPVDIVKTCSPL